MDQRFPIATAFGYAEEGLLDILPDGLIVLDDESRLVFANTAACRQFGLDASSHGLPLRDVFSGTSFTRNDQPLSVDEWPPLRLLRGEPVADCEVEVQGTGRRWRASFGGGRFMRPGLPRLAAVVVRDVTPMVERQRQLEEALARAEEVSRAKSRFLAAASHDLRQPLSAISLMLGVLAPHLAGTPAAEIIDRTQASVGRLVELFNTLLDISKLDSGVLDISRTTVPLAPLLARLAREFAPLARQKRLAFRVVPGSVAVDSDPVLLERILRNLITNALRYTTTGGVVVGPRRRGDTIRIDVCDTGPGITEAQRQRILTSFYHGARRSVEHFDGHGIGLSVVRSLVEVLDHTLELDSRPGRGTRFSVVAPALVADCRPATETPNRGVILVVEDDPMVASAIGLALEDQGCDVLVASDAAQARPVVATVGSRLRTIVTDYWLTDTDGLALIGEVRRTLNRSVPALLVTGDVTDELARRAQGYGVRCLVKPVSAASLQQAVAASGHGDQRRNRPA